MAFTGSTVVNHVTSCTLLKVVNILEVIQLLVARWLALVVDCHWVKKDAFLLYLRTGSASYNMPHLHKHPPNA